MTEIEKIMGYSNLFEIPDIRDKKDRFLGIMCDFIDLIYDSVIEKLKDDNLNKS